MSDTLIIDAHMHIYPSREQGLRNKSTYTVWEYGEKASVQFSPHSGDVEDALSAIRHSAVDGAVVVNLFAVSRARGGAIAELPEHLEPTTTCVELAVPIIAHAGPSRGAAQFAAPRAFVRTLREFPDLMILLAHLGGARGGRPSKSPAAFRTRTSTAMRSSPGRGHRALTPRTSSRG